MIAILLLVLCSTPPADERPNIVFVMADDLGYGDLGCYGQERIETPMLDRLAAEGLRSTQYYAGSTVCAPSRCVLMTGLHTGHARIRGNARQALLDEDRTIAEVLQDAGYATGIFGKWGLGEAGSSGIPTRQGFDEWFGYLNQQHAHNYYPEYLWRGEEKVPLANVVTRNGEFGGVATERGCYSHDRIFEEALDFVDRHAETPFFLYLPVTLPHANNEAGERGMEVPDLDPYADRDWPAPQKGHAAMISRLDRDVGRLLARLEELGIDDRTIVFFTSDNGPHDEGGARADFFDSNGPLRGIKRDLTEGGIRVPMIVRWPGKIAAGRVLDEPWAAWDVLPTLTELGGAALPDGLDGRSAAGLLLGGNAPSADRPLYWAFYERGGAQALRLGRWKAIARPVDAPPALYDLGTDPAESNDVAAEHPEVVARMAAQMLRCYEPSEQWKFPRRDR
jgi:arylsulfatase A-like enzyme